MPRFSFLRIIPSFVFLFVIGSFSAAYATPGSADGQSTPQADQNTQKADQARDNSSDPLKRPIDEKRKKQNARSLRRELTGEYRKWLDEDVRWIITDNERKAFMQLS
ncbi:MAG TPA: GWxTD domain-containing protein, partial [Terriglobales bacterium]|nr:GWxTD domain-containing protein [Terriglobales bacterium]